jgi:hypothetical protein
LEYHVLINIAEASSKIKIKLSAGGELMAKVFTKRNILFGFLLVAAIVRNLKMTIGLIITK